MPVRIYEVASGAAREVLYDPGLFDFGVEGFAAELPEDLGFAGFRLHAPLNRPDHHDEVRGVPRRELFPRRRAQPALRDLGARRRDRHRVAQRWRSSRHFVASGWSAPSPGAAQLVVYALLDGPSVSGAYTFRVRPGNITTIEVEATLFARQSIELLGIAPLTSMFLFGPNDRRRHRRYPSERP